MLGGAVRTQSAVRVPVFRDTDAQLRIVLVVRAATGLHGGQLSLPGGKRERRDASPLETALRETEEEIGLRRAIDVVAELAPIDTAQEVPRVSVRGPSPPPARWRLSPGEIESVVTPPASTFMDRATRSEQVLAFPGWPERRPVDCIMLEGGHLLWGLTLRLLDGIAPRLLADEWKI
jgi:8-oxo-dGTP pyrophosphatase MutT (NUDIX family)